MFTRAGQPSSCILMLYVGEGSKREQCCLLCSLLVFSHFPCYPQANWALLVPITSWACTCSGTLWVSPTNSPVRLGVSPAATSTPTGVFSQRFEALFPRWSPGLRRLLPCKPAAALPSLLHNPPPCWVLQPPPCHESSLLGCPALPLLQYG